MSKAEPLYRLQLLDTDLDQARRRLRDVEQALAANPAVAHAREELEVAHQASFKSSTEVKSLELEARSLEDKIKSEEDRLYTGNIRTPKELIDLQHEVETLKRHRSTLEDNLLGAMLTLEELLAVERHCRTAVDEAVHHWEADSVGMNDESAQLKDRISADEERRAAISMAIPRADLEIYNNLRAKKAGGVAVAPIKDHSCSVCGEEPSSVLLQQARTGSSLAMCTGCGRILFPG